MKTPPGLFTLLLLWTLGIPAFAAESEVRVIGEMRRMFTAHDIGANVDLAKVNHAPHLYGLGPLNGLHGEVTVLDGQTFVSRVEDTHPGVVVDPKVKSVFLVYAVVPAWRSIALPTNVVTESDLSDYLEQQMPKESRSAFLVHATAATARYHIQNYKGTAKELTHEAHDKAKSFYELHDAKVDLVGFFTNREEDAGSFVHMGQKTHIHLISADRKHMGHLESIRLQPGAELRLPQ